MTEVNSISPKLNFQGNDSLLVAIHLNSCVVPEMSLWNGPFELHVYRGHALCYNLFPCCSLSVVSVLRSPTPLEANRMTTSTCGTLGKGD